MITLFVTCLLLKSFILKIVTLKLLSTKLFYALLKRLPYLLNIFF